MDSSPPPPRSFRPRASPPHQRRSRNTKNLFLPVHQLSRSKSSSIHSGGNRSASAYARSPTVPHTAVPQPSPGLPSALRPAAMVDGGPGPEFRRHKSVGGSGPRGLSLSIPDSPLHTSMTSAISTSPPQVPSSPRPDSNNSSPEDSPKTVALTTVVMPPNLLSPSDQLAHEQAGDHYPQGPVLIVPPNVYLYSEPTTQEAEKFDVVINVAREVVNPYQASKPATDSITATGPACATAAAAAASSTRTSGDPAEYESTTSSVSSTDCSPIDNCGILSSSSTPSSVGDDDHPWSYQEPQHDHTALQSLKPEYIHMPWDHNSRLTSDLEYLTNLIDRRANGENKKVLIHCQCGISRSASLVVAYVMKQRQWDLNTAYEHVKQRSPSISPNMTLMFQLIDWQRMLNDPSLAFSQSSPTRFIDQTQPSPNYGQSPSRYAAL